MPREWMLTASLSVQVDETSHQDTLHGLVDFLRGFPIQNFPVKYQNLSVTMNEIEAEVPDPDEEKRQDAMRHKVRQALAQVGLNEHQVTEALQSISDWGVIFRGR